jgi:hypothetical protein
MPEMNALVCFADYSQHSDQPLMKNIKVHVRATVSRESERTTGRCAIRCGVGSSLRE